MYEEQQEAGMSNFSGTNNVFNQDIKNGNQRGLYRSKTKGDRATIQITVENPTLNQQVFELFNSNNSIAIQPDGNLYSGQGNQLAGYAPLDLATIVGIVRDGAVMPKDYSAWTRKGNLVLMDNGASLLNTEAFLTTELSVFDVPNVKVSLRSTLGGNTYKRLVEKMRTSVVHVSSWKIQCSNENQFQLSIAQKDFTITGASSDDEYQISSSVSSKDNNTKIVEINDKMLLIDGDTRLSGIILPQTTMVYTFEVDIINEVTKRVF